jgi:hypothetical protein
MRRTSRTAIITISALVLGLAGINGIGLGPAAAAATVTPPDLVVRVPTDAISIGIDPGSGHRMLHFSHISSDVGAGPFEIDPAYNSATGTARFSQAIYRTTSPGHWTLDHRTPIAAIGVFHPPTDYDFPLNSFSLLNKSGRVVARSPKTDYCITGDYQLSGIAHTPNTTSPPQSNCGDPTKPLGWSVGWGDEYDQTDNGQPIDLTRVPNGTYTLRGIIDPQHVFYESNALNDVTDTKLTIRGTRVVVGTQTHPRLPLPSVAITSPRSGAGVHGPVTVSAAVSASTRIRSVQFLLDGAPLGAPDTTAPYRVAWHAGGVGGTHYLSARVTAGNGVMNTARPVPVHVTMRLGGLLVGHNLVNTGTSTATTARFGVGRTGALLLALVGADGPLGQHVTVSGAGLRWSLVRRADGQPGDAEIWKARAPGSLHSVAVTARAGTSGYHVWLNLVTLQGAIRTGATAARSAASGSPHVSYRATAAGSIGFAVGNDFDRAVAPAPGAGQLLINRRLDTTGDTYWSQARGTGARRGATVTLNDSSPSGDHTNLAAVEVLAAAQKAATSAAHVALVNPTGHQSLSGTVPVAVQTTGRYPVRFVRYLVDGRPLGSPVFDAPYASRWHTTGARDGWHTLTARLVDTAGHASSTSSRVLVRNPAPPMTCFVLQRRLAATGRTTVSLGPFSTAAPAEILLAMVSADGPAGLRAHVTGGSLNWRLVGRANAHAGDAEVWTARVRHVRGGIRVMSTLTPGGQRQLLTVVALEGVTRIGSMGARSGTDGAAHAGVRLSGPATSLVFAAGSGASTPRPPVGQIFAARSVFPRGSALWSQYTNQGASPAGSMVTMRARTRGPWNLVAVEAVGDTE